MQLSIEKKYLLGIIITSLLVRCLLAYYFELNNEEAYYWTYALFPDWSHFDNPSMVGWVIQLCTWNLKYDSPLFIRLGAIIIGSINTLLIFFIGKTMNSEKTGLYAAFFYTISTYGGLFLGVYMLPDTPQSMYWLATLYLCVKIFSAQSIRIIHKLQMFLIGGLIGFGILSKYNSIFLWIGILIYIALFNREWLKKYSLYISLFITFLCISPILWWNIKNKFIGFYRIDDLFYYSKDPVGWLFLKGLFWQIIYYNPIIVGLICLGLVTITYKKYLDRHYVRFLLCMSLPLLACFAIISFIKPISIQWILPATLPLLFIAAAYFETIEKLKAKLLLYSAGIVLVLFLIISITEHYFGFIPLKKYDQNIRPDFMFIKNDWRQLNKKFTAIRMRDMNSKTMDSNANILSNKWYQAAILDYYLARPNKIAVITIGFKKLTYEYSHINIKRGGLHKGNTFYFITSMDNFEDPHSLYDSYFKKIILTDTISIITKNKIINQYFVYQLHNLKEIPKL